VPRVVPAAAELVAGVELVAHRVDVNRRLVEVETVGHSDRDREGCGLVASELDERSEPLRLGPFAEVVEADARSARDDRQVVGVAPVSMHAAQYVPFRAHGVPLGRGDGESPRVAKELGEDAALVGVRLQLVQLDAEGKHRARIIAAPTGERAREPRVLFAYLPT
jgi:hypothetical protein